MRIRLKHDRLVGLLSQGNLSQNHWAMKLGLSRGHLSDLVNGRHPYPSPKTREKLLSGLGASFDDLFGVETGDAWTHESSASFQSTLVDRYVVDRELGHGGMGTVYLARDVKHGRLVAIKVVSPEVVSGVGADQFLKEIRYTARLEHPNILTLLDSGTAAGYPYYVMPYVRGGSLRQLLDRRERLSLDEALSLTRGVVSALRYAHENHVVHCDIKPENILLAEDHAYLADFGISRAVHAEVRAWGRRNELDSSAGTPAYVSPEQASGEPEVDSRSDIYSLGCVVFEMLSGTPPFGGTTTMEIVAKRFTTVVPDLAHVVPHVSRPVASVVRRTMALEAKQRYGSAPEFLAALHEASRERQSSVIEGVSLRLGKAAMFARRTVGLASSGHGRGSRVMASIARDLSYAFRSMMRRPAQTLVLVLTLALGIGVNAATFSVINTVLLRPLPYPDPGELAALWEAEVGGVRRISVTYPNFVDIRDQNDQFGSVAAYIGGPAAVTGGSSPLRAPAYRVSQEFFSVLGVGPLMGTTEASAAGNAVVVVSHDLWSSTFGADAKVVGKLIHVNGAPVTVIGVMPPGFAFPRGARLWSPQDLGPLFGPSRTAHNLMVFGRLKPASTLESAQAEMSGLARSLSVAYPGELDAGFDIAVTSLHEDLAGRARATLILLFAVVGVVLLIACGNMASVLLSQSIARSREMAIRRSLGADSKRLVAQMLTESAFIGMMGAAVGLALAAASLGVLNRIVPAGYLHSGSVSLDWRVMSFTLALGLLCGVLFGALPAWRTARRQTAGALRTDGTGVAAGVGHRSRLGGLFVVPQYAFSLAALIVAGLILKSLLELSSVDPGFETGGLITVDIDLPSQEPSSYSEEFAVADFHRALLDRVSALPGTVTATLDFSPPLSAPWGLSGMAWPEGTDDPRTANLPWPDWRIVGPGYFGALRIPIVSGRDFETSDAENAQLVVAINEALARSFWGSENPIGRRLRASSLDNDEERARAWLTVIAVVADVHARQLDRDPRPALYVPAFQHLGRARWADLVVSAADSPRALAGPIREIVRELDPELPIGRVETMDGWLRESIAAPRFRAALLTGFGALAVMLALLGVYGVMAYSVSQRRREMALRVALGAQNKDVVRLLTGEGLRFIVLGQIFGTAAALGLGRLLGGLLYDVSATDATVFLIVSPALAAVVLLTCYLPARRAGRVDPLEALKA